MPVGNVRNIVLIENNASFAQKLKQGFCEETQFQYHIECFNTVDEALVQLKQLRQKRHMVLVNQALLQVQQLGDELMREICYETIGSPKVVFNDKPDITTIVETMKLGRGLGLVDYYPLDPEKAPINFSEIIVKNVNEYFSAKPWLSHEPTYEDIRAIGEDIYSYTGGWIAFIDGKVVVHEHLKKEEIIMLVQEEHPDETPFLMRGVEHF